ncbi:MAG: hypothetical protein KKI09_13905 [Spirochaetes bacterium]|nr:hypothetical protein [Spirochaetota bacterium]MBU0956520.1 hypothetical protein [Spirochaetota bacterium]
MDKRTTDETLSRLPGHPLIREVCTRVDEIFSKLDSYHYLRVEDKQDFLWYHRFFREALDAIYENIQAGRLQLLDERSCRIHPADGKHDLHAALFVGSFDPFQMTHLAMALRYLASDEADCPLVYIIPEGHHNPLKPSKSDYEYRYNLVQMQLAQVFKNLVVPLDIGKDADTIEIFRRFIGCMSGFKLTLTHIIGSDVLPFAVAMLPEDLAVWRREAAERNNELIYKMFILRRDCCPPPDAALRRLEELGVPYYLDTRELVTPSSTDFRKNNAFSIVLPTPEIISHLEVLFRYRLNRNWSPDSAANSPACPPAQNT